ncbi:MAG: nucleotidyltransferase domain-containing protein [Nitrospirae bacterium]|nr:nucleotidyltransferase domain-containing protein [Nitrospirota bacterium]
MATKALKRENRPELRGFVRGVSRDLGDLLEEIILFGSAARGSLKPDSDIDVLVVLKRRSLSSSREVTRLATEMLLRYGRYLSVKIMTRRMFQNLLRLETPFMLNIRRDGKVLWKKG